VRSRERESKGKRAFRNKVEIQEREGSTHAEIEGERVCGIWR
jgi:hypothetical protein